MKCFNVSGQKGKKNEMFLGKMVKKLKCFNGKMATRVKKLNVSTFSVPPFHVRSSLIPFTLFNVAQTWLINHFDARANVLKEKKVQSSVADCKV